ncbi:serine hydrolase [Janibacter sp. G56]|uniref:serine hydrolase n=1 Tax=Janibacter sp. G56 TaxID=3418717 RepID=UPI003CFFE1C4
MSAPTNPTARRALALGAALTAGAIVAATPASATTSGVQAATPEARSITILCDGLGEDTVEIGGALGAGGKARVVDGGLVSLVGEPGFRGTDARGAKVEVPATGKGISCTGGRLRSVDLQQALPSGQASKALGTSAATDIRTEVTGEYTWTVAVADDPTARTTAPAQADLADAAFPFASKIQSYVNSRPGDVTVAVKVPGRSTIYASTKGSWTNYTASIVKVDIMVATMMRAQDQGRALSEWEKSKMVPMIRYSDNAATTELWNALGQGSGLSSYNKRLGLASTTMDSAGHWGLTRTTASDQVRLMEHLARWTGKVNATNRSYGLSLMRSVASDQDWGVTAGPPAGTVAVKNGWLPRTTGWHVNSIGLSTYSTPDYSIAVLTQDNPGSEAGQITTIEGVSRIVWGNRAALVPPMTTVKGDLSGDGCADMVGISSGGYLYRWSGDGSGGLGSRATLASGWGGKKWLGSPGDVNKDGRSDLLTVESNGLLRFHPTTSTGKPGTYRTIATGWGDFTDIATVPDIDKNGSIDLVARTSGGGLRRYSLATDGTISGGAWLSGGVGTYYSRIEGVQDVNGDGRGDLIGFSASGKMRSLVATSGGFTYGDAAATSGWQYKRIVTSPGELTGNARDDLIAVSSDGTVTRYDGTDAGGLAYGAKLGFSASPFTHLA